MAEGRARPDPEVPAPVSAAEAAAADTGMVHVPLEAFFALRVKLPRLRPLPPLDGTMRGWPDEAVLPDLAQLHGQSSFGIVRAGWSLEGLAFAVAVVPEHIPRVDVAHPFRSDGVEVWIDTRDSRTARRPTRFCHHFLVLAGGRGPGGREPHILEMNLGGARRPEDMGDLRRVRAAANWDGHPPEAAGYVLEFLLPREVLTGYAPLEQPSVALGYRLRHPLLGLQDLAFGEQFPLWRNPSLWLSARLDGAGDPTAAPVLGNTAPGAPSQGRRRSQGRR